jgi:hypothetical protein
LLTCAGVTKSSCSHTDNCRSLIPHTEHSTVRLTSTTSALLPRRLFLDVDNFPRAIA